MSKIEVDQKYFINHLVEKLTEIYENLGEVDDSLYNKEGFEMDHSRIRESRLELDKIIDAIK